MNERTDTAVHDFTAAAYYDKLNQGKLMGSRCTACGEIHVPPRPVCGKCRDAEVEWVELSGKGKLAGFTVIAIAPTAMLEAGYGRKKPYCSGVVELEEGPRISAQILDVDVAHPEKIAVGTPLKVAFVERGEGEEKQKHLAFEPEA
jgi:hypothetical protein